MSIESVAISDRALASEKIDFRISMLISIVIEAFFSQKRSFRDHFNIVFRAYFDRFSAYSTLLMIIMNRRFDRRFDWLVQLYFKDEDMCHDTMILWYWASSYWEASIIIFDQEWDHSHSFYSSLIFACTYSCLLD